jgi:hypothetical protein
LPDSVKPHAHGNTEAIQPAAGILTGVYGVDRVSAAWRAGMSADIDLGVGMREDGG